MNTLAKRISAFFAVSLSVSLVGCSTLSTGPQLPFDGVILAPNEKITLNASTAKRTEYFCSDGAVLRCERISFKLYCSCPGIRP